MSDIKHNCIPELAKFLLANGFAPGNYSFGNQETLLNPFQIKRLGTDLAQNYSFNSLGEHVHFGVQLLSIPNAFRSRGVQALNHKYF